MAYSTRIAVGGTRPALAATALNIAAILPTGGKKKKEKKIHTLKRCQNTEIESATKNHTSRVCRALRSLPYISTPRTTALSQRNLASAGKYLHNCGAQGSDKRNALHPARMQELALTVQITSTLVVSESQGTPKCNGQARGARPWTQRVLRLPARVCVCVCVYIYIYYMCLYKYIMIQYSYTVYIA